MYKTKVLTTTSSDQEERDFFIYELDEFVKLHDEGTIIKSPSSRNDMMILLDYCPFCGHKGILQESKFGWYGWCKVCGTEGPRHYDWKLAGKAWNNRSIKDIMPIKHYNAKNLKELGDKDIPWWNEKALQEISELLDEE